MEKEKPPCMSTNKVKNKFGENVGEFMEVDLYNANHLHL
jgi:hypothetical protein